MTSNLRRCLIFVRKPGNVNVLWYAAPKLALVPGSRYNCDVTNSFLNVCAKFLLLLNLLMCQQTVIILMYIIHTLMSVPSYVRIERGSYGVNDFKLNKVPLYRSKTC